MRNIYSKYIHKSDIVSKIKVLLIFFFIVSLKSYGQRNYLFENISIPEGLSNSEVHSILQDSQGFLWISTADGLNRYDGNSVKVFKNDINDTNTIGNNNCFAIAEDKEGFIWVGVFGNAISRFNPKNETFKRYPIEVLNNTNLSLYNNALCDSKGNLWFGSTNHGMQKFNRDKNKFERVFLDSTTSSLQWGQIWAIVELANGNILVSDYGGGIKIYNEKLNLFQPYYLKINYSPAEIASIFEDKSGNIWFGGKDQLIKYSPNYYTTENYYLRNLYKVPTNFDFMTGITQDDEGYIWAGIYRQGMYRIDPKSNAILKFDYVPENEIIAKFYKDKYSVIWIGTENNGLYKFDPLREPFNYNKFKLDGVASSQSNVVNEIAGSQNSKEIIVGTSAKGLFSYNLENNEFKKINVNFDKSLVGNQDIEIRSLAIDNDGNRWFTYNTKGLNKIDKNNILIPIKSPNQGKIINYRAGSLKIDLLGNIWIASEIGFEKYSPLKNEYSTLPTIMNKKISKELKMEINSIPNSREPISSILKIGEASNIEKKFSLNSDQKVLVICVGEGSMLQGNDGVFDTGTLLSSEGKTIWAMNEISKTFNDGGGYKNRISAKCLNLKKGDYKITFSTDVGHSYGNWNVLPPTDSSWYGIQILSINDSEYNKLDELLQKEITNDKYMPMETGTCIELSKRFYNVVWLGSLSNSFFKYDLNTGIFKQYNFDSRNKFSPNNTIRCIFEDREGIVWIATRNYLIRFDPVTEKLLMYNQKDGLPSNLVNSIIEDLNGNLWISTSSGLSKLNKNAPADKWNFVNFDTRDGLQGFSTSKANWISKDGEIFLGSNDGLISFYPGKINEQKPDIVFEDIKVSEISLKSDSAVVKIEKDIMNLDELILPYSQNDISFEFASIHFSRPEKNKLIYKLEGFNTHWTNADRNYVSFTNLDPGEYTFRVKGSNGDGIWNDEGKSIHIIISPPWWQTTFAYISYFFAFGGIIFGIDRIQRRRIVTRERNNAAIKEAELRAMAAEAQSRLVQAENERKTKELEEARDLQLSMLPKHLPALPHLDIAVYMKTATEVGGDYYDFNVGIDGTLTVVIGDATGHGMRAGTMVTAVKSLFNSYVANPDIVYTFHEMTRCIKQLQMQSVSMCLTMMKIQSNKLLMSSAGMPPMFLYKRENQIIEEHLLKGMPLGSMNNFPYEIKEMELAKGDTILLMSDGFPELVNENNELYGYKRVRNKFEEVAEKEPEEIISYLKNDGSIWVNDNDPDDDVTFVVLKVK